MKNHRNLLAIAGSALFAAGAFGAALPSVKAAYEAIPHQQTTFGVQQSTMPSADRQTYSEFFSQVDQAVVLRVHCLAKLRQGQNIDEPLAAYDSVVNALKASRVHAQVLQLVSAAVTEQRDYLKEWSQSLKAGKSFAYRLGQDPARHPKVEASAQKLHEAYSVLMGLFPAESAHNKKSFFDHLCALDFI